MEVAIAVGQHNLSAAPVILAVVLIGAVIYFFWQRRKNQPNGHDR